MSTPAVPPSYIELKCNAENVLTRPTATQLLAANPELGRSQSAPLTTPVIDGVTYSVLNNRQIIVVAFPVVGATLHAAVLNAVVFPAASIILRAVLDITTIATGACTIDVGYTTTTASTSDTLLDGVDANAAIALFDSMNANLDTGTNAFAQKAASGKFVTIDEKTGDSTGLVATLYVHFTLA